MVNACIHVRDVIIKTMEANATHNVIAFATSEKVQRTPSSRTLSPSSNLVMSGSRCGQWVGHADFTAKLCNDCGFGSRENDCAVCGNWVGSTETLGVLCGDCGFGSKGDECSRCSSWVGSFEARAKLCNDCGFGTRGEECCRLKP